MKKLLGWGAGLLLLAAVIFGSTTNTDIAEQANTAVQPPSNVGKVEIKEPVTETPAPQVQSRSVEQTAPEPVTAPEPEPKPKPKPTPAPVRSNCDPNYTPCVPNVSYDLDCSDISFSVTVIGSDHHRFDRDGDGLGCESN